MKRFKWHGRAWAAVCLLLCWMGLAAAGEAPPQAREAPRPTVRVKLCAGDMPLRDVQVSAWRQGSARRAQSAYTDENGEAVFDELEDGAYFLSGDITRAVKALPPAAQRSLQADGRLCFLSPATQLRRGESAALTVDASAYIDLVDFFGRDLDKISVRRQGDGLDIVVALDHMAKQLRLYLPVRRTYGINTYNNQDTLTSRFYVGPGLRYAIW